METSIIVNEEDQLLHLADLHLSLVEHDCLVTKMRASNSVQDRQVQRVWAAVTLRPKLKCVPFWPEAFFPCV
jgi:hypothetical protein